MAEARFTKLKLQAKAKMVSLNKQIHELKGQEVPAVSNSRPPDRVHASVCHLLQRGLPRVRLLPEVVEGSGDVAERLPVHLELVTCDLERALAESEAGPEDYPHVM